MIPGGKNFKEIERKKSGRNRSKNRVKTEEKQSSARFRRLKETSAKWAFCCQIIPQHFGVLCENFRSCEGEFGTRVPLCSTGASVSQLWNALRSGKAWFRTKNPIPQGISQLRKWFWHTCATSQHSDINFAAAKRIAKLLRKWHFAAKLAFCCETQTDP